MKTDTSNLLVKPKHRVVLRKLYNECLKLCDHDVGIHAPEGAKCACMVLWDLIVYCERSARES